MIFTLARECVFYRRALLPAVAAMVCLAGCNANHAQQLGRAESLYKSLGGPDFVGQDGGTNNNIVFNWFDAHYDAVAKFNGKGGVCDGYEPAGPMAQRERVVCAGASHAWLSKEMQRERTH